MKRIFSVLIMAVTVASAKASVYYRVAFDKANLHYVTVSITVESGGRDSIDFSMPVWSPGSYKVREFSQNIDRFEARNEKGKNCEVDRVNKNTWRVRTGKKETITAEYDVYAFTVSARHSYADNTYAFLHGVSAFMRAEGFENEEILLELFPLDGWSNVEVALPQTRAKGYVFVCTNYDLLADSPIALGNFDVMDYESGGVPHKVVMMGEGNYDREKITSDFKRIGDREVALFGDHPCDQYIHFVQNVASGGGGLEHMNSQTSQVVRWAYSDEKKYRSFLGLIAHEQFHLWNVKRIRPQELGPFDYDQENYTKQLWVVEGITSYYDDHILQQAGILDERGYLDIIGDNINRLENQPGKEVMNLEEASFNAWVKAYLSNENSDNVTISYYNKGMLVALLLDLEIIRLTDGNKTLDDVMRSLWDQYKSTGKGYSSEQFWKTVKETAGKDLGNYYRKYVAGTGALDYKKQFQAVGLEIKDLNAGKQNPWLGYDAKSSNGSMILSYIHPEGPAAKAGLSVNDEIVSLDGWRVTGTGESELARLSIGNEVPVVVARDGKMMEFTMAPVRDPKVKYEVSFAKERTDSQVRLAEVWLRK